MILDVIKEGEYTSNNTKRKFENGRKSTKSNSCSI